MDKETRFNQFARNPIAHAKHRRESFWQITFPLLIGGLVILAVVVGIIISATQPTTDVGRWADISLIWIILPALFFTLILLVILGALVFGVTALMRAIPRYTAMLLFYMQLIEERILKISNKVAEPFVKTNSIAAAVSRFFKRGKSMAGDR